MRIPVCFCAFISCNHVPCGGFSNLHEVNHNKKKTHKRSVTICDCYIISIAKTASKKIGALIRSLKFLSTEIVLYLYHTAMHRILSYLGWCPQLLLELLDKLQKQICRTVGSSLAASEIAKHCREVDHNFSCDRKKVVDRKNILIPRKIKETIHSLKNLNHINKISYMFPEIYLSNLRKLLVTYLFCTGNFQLMKFTQTRHFCAVNLYSR